MTWPTRVWAVGEVLTAANMIAFISDPMDEFDTLLDVSTPTTWVDGAPLFGGGATSIFKQMAILGDGFAMIGDNVDVPQAVQLLTAVGGVGRHELGMLETDVSGFDGIPLIDGGATTNLKYSLTETDAPDANDDTTDGWVVGSLWVDVTADKAYLCLDNTDTAAVWTEITQSGGASALATLSIRGVRQSTTNRLTLLTPSLGKRIRVIAMIHTVESMASQSGLETYFGTGANIATTPAKAIHESGARAGGGGVDAINSVLPLGDGTSGPLGATDEVVSIRTNASNGAESRFILHYAEED